MYHDYFVRKTIAESIGGNNNNHLDYMAHINQTNFFFFRSLSIGPAPHVFFQITSQKLVWRRYQIKVIK